VIEIKVGGRWPLLVPPHREHVVDWADWELPRLLSMRANLHPGDVLWDLGTEEGDLSALFDRWVGGMVLVEPVPRIWPNIRAVFGANGARNPLDWFVGFVGEATAPADGDPQQRAAATAAGERDESGWPRCSIGPIVEDHSFRHLAQETDTTPTTTIDDLQRRHGLPVTAVTMDIEGAEWPALHGARRVLRAHRPLLWISVHPDPLRDFYGNRTPGDVLAFLEAQRYRTVILGEDHEIHVFAYPVERDVVLPDR
jgi:FkbM family methyltransferase